MRKLSSARALVVVATAASLALGVVGCTSDTGGPQPTPEPSPSSSATDSPTPVSLRFGVYGDEEMVDAYTDLADAFMADHPEVSISIEPAFTAEDGMEKLRSQLAEERAPDVFVAEHEMLPELVAGEHVQPVDQLLEEREVNFGDGYQRDGLEAFSADARLQCMPHDVSPLVVYYNQELVDLAALTEPDEDPVNAEDGWTWEQFAAAARQAAQGRVKGVYVEPSLTSLAPFIWSAGGGLVDDSQNPTTLSLSEGDAREALETVLDVVRDPQLTPTPQQLARRDAATRFERGDLGMILGTRELTPRFRIADSLDFEVMPLPRLGPYRTISDMSGYCISANTAHVSQAADFVAFAVGVEGASITAGPGSIVPSNVAVAHSYVFTEPALQPENAFVFSEGVRRTEVTPQSPAWPEVVRTVQPLVQRLFYAPVIDLDALLEQIDTTSQGIFAPEETPTPE